MILLIILSVLIMQAKAGISPGQTDARTSGIANISTIIPGPWSAIHNPGCLALSDRAGMGISHNRYLLVNGLSYSSAVLAIPIKKTTIGLAVRNFGFTGFSNYEVSISTGIAFGENFTAGARIGYGFLNTHEDFKNYHSVAYSIGATVKITNRLLAGFHCNDPFPVKTFWDGSLLMASNFILGVKYEVVQNADILVEFSKSSPYPAVFRAGTELKVKDIMTLRCGVQVLPLMVSGGVSLELNKFRISIAFSFSENLGSIPCSTIDYYIK